MLPMQVRTGVEAGPIYSPQQHQAAVQGIGQFATNNQANQTYKPGAAGMALKQNYDQNSEFNASRNMQQADRSMTAANANEYNRSQAARAKAGGAMAQTGAQQYVTDLAQQSQRRNMIMSLLGNFMQG